MPTVFRHGAFRFYFYSNEGDPREPTHVHVRGAGGDATLWLSPDVRVAGSVGASSAKLREIVDIATRHTALTKGMA